MILDLAWGCGADSYLENFRMSSLVSIGYPIHTFIHLNVCSLDVAFNFLLFFHDKNKDYLASHFE